MSFVSLSVLQDLGLPTVACVEAALERAFLDKVIPEVGLVITLYDIVSIGPGLVHPSEGGAHRDVRFRAVVFRPQIGEMLRGSVVRCEAARGVQVSLGFFDDIWIPSRCLPKGTTWDAKSGSFKWVPRPEEGEEGEEAYDDADEDVEGAESFYIERGFDVRCKVVNLGFERRIAVQDAPGLQGGGLLGKQAGVPPPSVGRNGPAGAASGPAGAAGGMPVGVTAAGGPAAGGDAAEEEDAEASAAVMVVTGVADGSGLGMVHWFPDDNYEEEEEEPMET